MIKNIENIGVVNISGTRIYTHVSTNLNAFSKMSLIKFNNTVPYVITLKKYNAKTKQLVNLYELDLADGDTVFDSSPYLLLAGEYLQATCDVAGTTFLTQAVLTT